MFNVKDIFTPLQGGLKYLGMGQIMYRIGSLQIHYR